MSFQYNKPETPSKNNRHAGPSAYSKRSIALNQRSHFCSSHRASHLTSKYKRTLDTLNAVELQRT